MGTAQNQRHQAFRTHPTSCHQIHFTRLQIWLQEPSDYPSVHLLLLSLWFEYLDITFLIKCLKDPSDQFNMSLFIKSLSYITRASSGGKLRCTLPRSSINAINFFYFNRVVKLWNSLPIINCSLSTSTIKSQIETFLWSHFISTFDPHTTYTWFICCPCPSYRYNNSINLSNFIS